jgi:outer membrane receptor protein involved in Fe transport
LTFSIRIDQEIKKDFFLNLNTEYTSRRFNYYENWNNLPEITMDTKELKPYYLVNVHLRRKIFEGLMLSLGIRNLFDIHYAVQFGNGLNDRDYPMPGRTFIAGISWN